MRFSFKRRYRHLWIATSRLTRQVLSFFLGDRSIQSLRALWAEVPAAYRRKQVSTDEYEVSASFFRPWQQRPSPKRSGRTSLPEGLDNQWRNRLSGLVRKTVCVRYEEDLVLRLLLTFEEHNGLCKHELEMLEWLLPSTQ